MFGINQLLFSPCPMHATCCAVYRINKASTSSGSTSSTTQAMAGSDDDYGYDEDTTASHLTGDGAAVNNLKLQAINYLSEANSSLSSLQSYPSVQTVFVRYNTSLTSSAAVERLFSCAGLISTSRRNRLSDSTFEKLLMLKVNHYEPQ